jgi:hypothetical protein
MATLASVILRDIAANRPAAGIAGRLFYDTTNSKMQRDNGSSWDDVAETGGLTNPMTTTGDVIVGGASGTPTRLAAGAIGTVLRSGGAGVAPAWAAGGVAVATAQGSGSADYTTSSASFADVDGTNLIITPTNAATGDILEIMAFVEGASSGTINTGLTFSVAGTDVGDTLGLAFWTNATNVGLNLIYYYTMPSSTQPAIKLRWKTASGTASMYNRSAVIRPRMVVKNLSRGGTL